MHRSILGSVAFVFFGFQRLEAYWHRSLRAKLHSGGDRPVRPAPRPNNALLGIFGFIMERCEFASSGFADPRDSSHLRVSFTAYRWSELGGERVLAVSTYFKF